MSVCLHVISRQFIPVYVCLSLICLRMFVRACMCVCERASRQSSPDLLQYNAFFSFYLLIEMDLQKNAFCSGCIIYTLASDLSYRLKLSYNAVMGNF